MENLIPKEFIEKYKEYKKLEKELEQYEGIKDILKAQMKYNNQKSIVIDNVTFQYVAEYKRENFDKKRFKLEHPKMFKEYLGYTNVSDSIKIII